MTRRSVSAGRVCVFLLAVAALASSLTLNALPLPKAADNAGKHDATVASAPAGKAPVFLVAPSISVAGKPAAIVAGDLNGDGAPDLIVANAQTGNVDVLLSDGKGAFQAPVHYKIGGSPTALVLGDFTGHGKIDIAVANQSGNSVSVLLGKGDGTFQAAVTYTVGAGPVALAVGDFNGDGHPDLLVANAGSNTLAVLTNNGDGTFQSAKFCALSASPLALAIADFNSDGKLDVASGNADGTVSILLGDGTGRLNIAATMTAATRVSALVVGDFNADGKADLAVADPVASTVSVFLGRGDGTFQSSSVLAVGNEPVSLALEDLNADGVPDLLAVNKSGNTVSVMLGAGNGSFQPSLDCVVGNSPVAVAIADFNGDGHLDLATANSADGTVTVPLGNGDGTFQAAQDYRTHLERKSVAVGDLNGDGHPDVVVASLCGSDPECAGNGTASVFLSNGKGALKPGSIYALGKGPISIALADVNGDKKLDLIAVNRDDATVMVLLGNGDGTFQEGVTYPAGVNPVSVSVGDFNKDGKADLAIAALCGSAGCHQQGSVNTLLGNGDGSFKSGASYDVDMSPVSVAVGDVNGDGVLDLVVANSCGKSAACSNGTASVLLGDGKGNFTLKTEVDLGKQVSSVALADLNGDGKLDLIAANSADNQVGVLLGKGDGTFNNQVKYEVGVGPSGVVVADFDGDGLPDVAVANLKNSTVSLLHGNGDGSLQTAVAYPVGFGPDALAALDLTGSGRPALVTANGNSGGSPAGNDITVLATAGITAGTTSSTTTLTASANPSVYGQSVAFQATVTGASGTPTGNVQFMDGATDLGSPVALDGTGAATLNWATLDVAHSPHSITAVYSGDATYASSTSSPVSQTVNAASTTTAVTSSANPSVFGQSVTFTATVMDSSAGSTAQPTGSVQFVVDGVNIGSHVALTGDTSNSSTATSQATATLSVAGSPHTVTASYVNADGNFSNSVGTLTGGQVVNKANTTTAVTSSVNPSVSGQSVMFTATVSPVAPGAGTPTGTVTFLDGGSPIGAGTLSGAGVATFTTSALAVGNHTITTSYGGDGNFNGNTGSLAGNPQVVNEAVSATAVSSSANPSVFGQAVTFSATVTAVAPGSGTPSGTVQLVIDGGNVGPALTLAGGAASFPAISTLTVGTHTVAVKYSGDSNFLGITGNLTPNQSVGKATSATAVSSSANPSVSGQAVTFSAMVTAVAPGAGTPSGSVQLVIDGSNVGSAVTLAAGSASFPSISTLTVGSHTVAVIYSGDSNFLGITGNLPTQTVGLSSSKTVVNSSVNPSVFGQPVTFSATVSAVPPGTGTPSGTVQLVIDGANVGTTVTLDGTGKASFPAISNLSVGSHTVAIKYSGDSNFAVSTGNLPTQTVNQASTTTTATSTPNPSIYFQQVTFSATVSSVAPGAGTPTGTVTFTSGGTFLCSAILNGGTPDTASCTYSGSALPVPSDTVTAAYGGDTNFLTSNGTITQTINKATTTTVVTSSLNPSHVNLPVTFTATVTGQYGGTPTGTVTFTAGTTTLCSGKGLTPVAGVATATCTYANLGAATYTVTASYSSDSNFLASSGTVTQVVDPTTTSTTFTTTASVIGASLTFTFTATVSPTISGFWSPTGTVNFYDGATLLNSTPAPLNANLQATFALTTELSTGTHSITAVYNGDANFLSSTSAATSLSFEAPGSQTVVSGQPSGGVSLTPNGATAGTAVTFSCLGIGGTGISGVLAPNPAGYFTNPNGNGVTPFVSCWFTSLTSTAPAGTTLTICTALPAPTNCTTGLTVGVVRPNLELRPHRTWYSLALFLPAITFLGAAVPFAIGFRKGKFRIGT